MVVQVIEYWKEFLLSLGALYVIIAERRLKKASADKEEAIAEQEKIKIKKEDTSLSSMVYQRLNKDIFSRLEDLENSNEDLTKKYNEMLLRNAILEERAETYEQKYKTLEKDHNKLKSDHDKLNKENKEIRKELDELKKTQ
jgi:chromosome segregation ATPase